MNAHFKNYCNYVLHLCIEYVKKLNIIFQKVGFCDRLFIIYNIINIYV